MIGTASSSTAYARLYQEISAMISCGRWKEGERIPTEKEMASSFGVSIGTVRRAMDLLEQDGFCRRVQGKGTFVSSPVEDAPVFYRLRRTFSDTDIRILPRGIERTQEVLPPDAAQALGLADGSTGIRIMRQLRYSGAGSYGLLGTSESWFPADLCAALLDTPLRDLEKFSLYHLLQRDCRAPVMFCDELVRICTAPPDLAGDTDNILPGAPCFRLAMTSFTYGKRPLEYRISFIVPGPMGLMRRHDLRQFCPSTL